MLSRNQIMIRLGTAWHSLHKGPDTSSHYQVNNIDLQNTNSQLKRREKFAFQ